VSEFRQDPLTGGWVIIAPERAARPKTSREGVDTAPPADAFDPRCPFCPGNEEMVPGIIEETPGPGPAGWLTRVVPNKYPALGPEAAAPAFGLGGEVSLPGQGAHEVVIESPRHDADLETLPGPHVAEILRTCRRRHAELMARPDIRAVVVFRNRGPQGGASLAHPHSQVIATGMLPPRLARASAWAKAHHQRHGRCVTCETLGREAARGRRVVELAERFAVLVPFAPVTPFEQRIMPVRHRASFAEAEDAELDELAEVLQRTLRRLDACLGRPPYNLVIESAPAGETGAAHLHWGLRIVPARHRPGGFEIAAGMEINTSLPEDDARRLREAEPGEAEG
jgi:UDPglucose--hexose-1-phosphate uridylyltransferase